MTVTIIKHGEQIFAKNEQGEILKVKGVVIPKYDKPTAYYDESTTMYKLVCAENTKHHAEYVSAGMCNIYPNREIIEVD